MSQGQKIIQGLTESVAFTKGVAAMARVRHVKVHGQPSRPPASASGPVDGRGWANPDGECVRLYVKGDGQAGHHWRIISRRDAEMLVAELREVLDHMPELAKAGSTG